MMRMAPTEDCPWTTWMFNWSRPGSCYTPEAPATTIIRNSIFEPWVEDAKMGVQDMTKQMITFWIDIPDPDIGTPQGVANPIVTFLSDRLLWFGAVIMCFVVLFNIGRIMWEEHKVKPARAIAMMVMVYLGTAALTIPVMATSLMVTNWVAQEILLRSTEGNTNFADNIFGLFNNLAGVASSILIIILLIAAIFISGLMCLIMIGRGSIFYVLVAGLLTQAAGYGTDSGKEGYMTSIGWIKGLLLYKMAAAAIFGVGFKFLSTNTAGVEGQGLLQMLYGLALLLLAVLALPASMRVTAPATSQVASGQGVGAAAAGSAPMLAAGMLRR
jgi:type IV secretion system protein TrbL